MPISFPSTQRQPDVTVSDDHLAASTPSAPQGVVSSPPLSHISDSTNTMGGRLVSASSATLATTSPWSNTLQTVLDRPPASFPIYVAMAGLAFSSLFAAWTWFGTVQEVSHAYGQLVPKGDPYKIQPTIQGDVTQILVEEGQSVKAGQMMMTLDSRLAEAEVVRLQQSLTSYQTQLIQTQGKIERAQLEVQTREAIAQADVFAQEAAIVEAEAGITTLETLLVHLENDIQAHQQRLDRLHPLVDDGAIAADNLFSAEQSLREREQSLIQYQGDLQKKRAELERLQSLRHQREATGQQSYLESQQQLQQLHLEVTQFEAHIAETKTLIHSARTKLEQTVLYAPADGIVLDLAVEHQGEVLQPGQTIAELAPLTAPLVLSAALPIKEAGLVEVGMGVHMKFDAFPYQDYGVFTGRVTAISPDTETDEQRGTFYTVEVELERDRVTHNNRQIPLTAGQTASADIVTRERRILDVLLDPIRQLQEGGINL